MASLYLEGEGDLYHLATDAFGVDMPWELWRAVRTLRLDRHTAEAILDRSLLRRAGAF